MLTNSFNRANAFGRQQSLILFTGDFVLTGGTKSPLGGASGSASHPPSGWTALISASVDDNFTSATIPAFTINGTDYTTAFIGSNTYFTFGSGSNVYNPLSASSPALPKIFLGSADHSYQRVSSLISTYYTRIRYEGTNGTSGTPGNPNIVFEATFFDKTKTGNLPVVEVLFGTHGSSGSLSVAAGIASSSNYYARFVPTDNQSFVFVGNLTGTRWSIYRGYYISGAGY